MNSRYSPAFPVKEVRTDRGMRPGAHGINNREYFIAAALTGLLANPSYKIVYGDSVYPQIKDVTELAEKIGDTICKQLES